MPSQPALKPGHVFVDVVAGVEGASLYVCNENIGHRLAGPKPWGGGRTIHRFVVKADELIREATAYAATANDGESGNA